MIKFLRDFRPILMGAILRLCVRGGVCVFRCLEFGADFCAAILRLWSWWGACFWLVLRDVEADFARQLFEIGCCVVCCRMVVIRRKHPAILVSSSFAQWIGPLTGVDDRDPYPHYWLIILSVDVVKCPRCKKKQEQKTKANSFVAVFVFFLSFICWVVVFSRPRRGRHSR